MDTTPPTVTSSSFSYLTGHSISMKFSEPVDASTLTASDLTVQRSGGGASLAPTSVSYDTSTMTATFAFATPLADGDYTATLAAGAVSDPAGNALASAHSLGFFALAGDANHDRVVDVTDLGILATNWQGMGRNFAQGDFNYDGTVDVTDLGILATNWQKSLAAPAGTMSLRPMIVPPIPIPIAGVGWSRRAEHTSRAIDQIESLLS